MTPLPQKTLNNEAVGRILGLQSLGPPSLAPPDLDSGSPLTCLRLQSLRLCMLVSFTSLRLLHVLQFIA